MNNFLKQWANKEKRIIVLEGPDSSGKTTQSKLLVDAFGSMGVRAEKVGQPHTFRDRLMTDKNLTENERVALFLEDYDLTVARFLHETPIQVLVMDRIPYVSYYIYNKDEAESALLTNHVEDRFKNIVHPNIIFILNRPSLKEPDGTIYEQRINQIDMFNKYSELPLSRYTGFCYVRKLFEPVGALETTADKETVTNEILDQLGEMAYWTS